MSDGPPSVPLVYRFVRDASGQSETMGIALLLGMTVVGTVAIVALGTTAMTETENAAHEQRVEHTMTLFDSRAAMVALGDSDQQEVRFDGSNGGSLEVRPDSGRILVEHYNYSGNGAMEELYNGSLGAFVYEIGDDEIAYQGGGVWNVEGNSTRMVSPPEFHYRDATLTLPVIQIGNADQAAGTTTAVIRPAAETERHFPNASANYDDDPDNPTYANPIVNGTVNVTVRSDYYRGWARYFRTRTDNDVAVDHANQSVTMELLTPEDIGDFGNVEDDLTVGNLPEGHTVENFTVTLQRDDGGNWGQVFWSFYVDEPAYDYEMAVWTPGGSDCNDLQTGTEDLHLAVFYHNGSGESQEWHNDSVPVDSDFVEELDCSEDTLTVNFTAENTTVAYRRIQPGNCGSNNDWHFDTAECTATLDVGTTTFDEHVEDGGETYNTSTNGVANISYVMNHYFALMAPNFEIQGNQGPGVGAEPIDEGESFGTLTYDQGFGKFLTYLHVTENEVEITFG